MVNFAGKLTKLYTFHQRLISWVYRVYCNPVLFLSDDAAWTNDQDIGNKEASINVTISINLQTETQYENIETCTYHPQ